MDLINLWPTVKPALLTSGFIDDFDGYVTGDRWSAVGDTGAGALAAQDADDENGVVVLTTGAVDNNEIYIATRELAKCANGKPILLYGRIQFAEANTDDANIIFGIGEGFGAANTLLDNGGGPPADYDGACFFKVDGGTRWQFESSDGTSQVTVDTEKTAGGAGFHTLAIEILPLSASEMQVVPWIDTAGGNNLIVPMRNGALPREGAIVNRHSFSAGEMAMVFGAKAGAGNSEVLKVDLAIFQKKR